MVALAWLSILPIIGILLMGVIITQHLNGAWG
jgi:hypothetical protein